MSGPIDRIVVPLDATSEYRMAIDTATRLAARAKAPLHGVFVEDEDLLNLASLPFARQVTPSAGAEPFTTESIELHLRAQAERARRELFAAAQQHQVKCTFETVRGASELAVSGASKRDLVVAGGLTRAIAGHFRVESRWWSSIEAAAGPFLLARHAWSAAGGVVMLLRDRGPAAVRLFDVATQMAETRGGGILTVICPPAVASSDGFEKWITDQVTGHSVRLQIEVAPAEPAALHRRIVELDCQLLVIEAGFAEGRPDRLRELVERFACDILVVR